MRLSWNRLAVLMVGLLVAVPALAQRQPGGGFGRQQLSLSALLQNKSVQEELKLTEDQVSKLKTVSDGIRDKFKEEMDKAKEGKDFKAFGEIFKKINDATTEAVTKEAGTLLKPEQLQRIKQIEVQVQGVSALTKEDVQKELKLSEDQVGKIKGLLEDMNKDIQDAGKEAGKDFKKRQEATTKIRTATQEKITEILSETQQKSWKDMTGEKFELKFGRPGGV